jgi:hypothetical protein
MQLFNGTYYQFDSWSDGGAEKHFVTPSASVSAYTANLRQTPAFTATYYNNTNLTGSPVLTRAEGMIDYRWDFGSPSSQVNSDNFSARWVKQHYFRAGSYTFTTLSDDGIRLYIDGTAVIDKWIEQSSYQFTTTINLTEGNHEIKLEYYEKTGAAEVHLNWEPTSQQGNPVPPASGQSITSMSLINANTDQVSPGFETITAGSTINLASLPTRSLNIRANTNPSTVGSVRFGFDGNNNFQTETNSPYALASDEGGNYNPWTPSVGSHTVVATPFTATGATGTAGTPLTIAFTITDSAVSTPTPTPQPGGQSITSFTLINADTEQPVAGFNPIAANAILALNSLPTRNLNIRANTNPSTVGSVRFGLDGNNNFQTETNTPYALASDENANYNAWTPSVGNHTVVATPFSAAGGAGSAGTPLSLSFSVTDGGTSTPTPTQQPGGQSITSFSLINADTDQVISGYDQITNGATISLSALPTRNINVRANSNPGTVGSVRFGYDGNNNFQTETNTPYALASDEGGNYYPWTPSVGSHTITATPYTAAGGGGTAGTSLTISITISN